MIICDGRVRRGQKGRRTHGKRPLNWEMKCIFLLQGKCTIFLQLLTLQPTLAPFNLHRQQV